MMPRGVVGNPIFAQAFTHRSGADTDHPSNERLEFLGDAVIELAITEYLYERLPEADEGRLTKLRSALVSRAHLGRVGDRLELASRIQVGQADALTRNAVANALEAVVGAVFVLKGFEAAKGVVVAMLRADAEALLGDTSLGDYKSRLFEELAKERGTRPRFRASPHGPDHARTWTVELRIEGKGSFAGAGRTKLEAEQDAARQALEALGHA